MLSPTLALRCPYCQHALALADIRDASTCPACQQVHGLPPAVADALALYERAIQQAVTDLVGAAPEPSASPSAPASPAVAPAKPGPVNHLLAAPVRPGAPLSVGPAPRPAASEHVPEDTSQASGETLRAPVSEASSTPTDRPDERTPASVGPAPRPAASEHAPEGTSQTAGETLRAPVSEASSTPTDRADLSAPASDRADLHPAGSESSSGATDERPPASAPADLRAAGSTSPLDAPPPPPGPLFAGLAAEPASPALDPTAGPALKASPDAPAPEANAAVGPLAGPVPEASPDLLPAAPAPEANPASAPANLSRPAAASPGPGDSRDPAPRMSGDTLPGATVPSSSSLLSILYNRSGASISSPAATAGLAAPAEGLAEAPLRVDVVRESSGDAAPAVTSDLVAAVRSVLPDRPDAAVAAEPEGRIPATALAVARRALLARHAEERRQQQIHEGGSGLFFTFVVCLVLAMAGAWYVAAPIAFVAIFLRLRREEHGERFGAEVQRLADALGGQRLPSYDAIAAWFDGLWPAPVSPEAMWTSHLHGAVRCDVGGYAALVDIHLNEKTAGGVVYPPRITTYLAAVWPGRVPSLRPSATDLSPEVHARLARLRKAGYTITADAHGGLVLRASESMAASAREDITRLAALQLPLAELADLARDLGAEPVSAL